MICLTMQKIMCIGLAERAAQVRRAKHLVWLVTVTWMLFNVSKNFWATRLKFYG